MAYPNAQSPLDNGAQKDFIVSEVLEYYDLLKCPADIEQMLRVDRSCNAPGVIEASIGPTADGMPFGGVHSLNVAGLICDPAAQTLGDKYKGIILIDNENDGRAESFVEDFNAENEYDQDFRLASKEQRPNSYTVYGMELHEFPDRQQGWVLQNFTETGNEMMMLCDFTLLPLYDEALIAAHQETEGTKDAGTNVDLSASTVMTTLQTTPPAVDSPYLIEDFSNAQFTPDDQVNMLCLIANGSRADLSPDYPDGNTLTVNWVLRRRSSFIPVQTGTESVTLDIPANTRKAMLTAVNQRNGEHFALEPDDYILSVTVNDDRKITESYYYNNKPTTAFFTVTGDASPTEELLGDVNSDGLVNASDAAQVLIYSAAQGAGEEVSLCDGEDADAGQSAFLRADTDANGRADAADGSNILIYAALTGADSNAGWYDVLY